MRSASETCRHLQEADLRSRPFCVLTHFLSQFCSGLRAGGGGGGRAGAGGGPGVLPQGDGCARGGAGLRERVLEGEGALLGQF